MRIEIVYMDRTKDSEEFECNEVIEHQKILRLYGVIHPFKAARVNKTLDDVDYYVEYE